MSKLTNKIDFIVLVSANMANVNGDPLNGNRPRTDYNGFGEMSDVCIKRKIRNRMQDLGNRIFVQSDDRADDDFTSLSERASKTIGKVKNKEEYARKACEEWLDVRTFGQVFAFKSDSVSVGVRGPVSIHQAVSASPVEIQSIQITKSVNGEPGEKKASDTMGMKHFVRFGLYKIKGSINVQLAEKTGFTEDDAETVKECLRTLFVNDASSARPDGSMEVIRVFWWKHNCKDGQYSSAKVHKLLNVALNEGVSEPSSADDYTITVDSLPDLALEVIDGI
ncbi:MAG: type I-C CRISPR-associated protein Cas7/Csd2 [Clostridia bacterium]|nr:type I-C CRISPR-associated protein Cas7/Csd2 [Clostridia bacterium]